MTDKHKMMIGNMVADLMADLADWADLPDDERPEDACCSFEFPDGRLYVLNLRGGPTVRA